MEIKFDKVAIFAAFAKWDTGAYSDRVRYQTLEFLLRCYTVSGGSYHLKLRLYMFVSYEYSVVTVREHSYNSMFVSI